MVLLRVCTFALEPLENSFPKQSTDCHSGYSGNAEREVLPVERLSRRNDRHEAALKFFVKLNNFIIVLFWGSEGGFYILETFQRSFSRDSFRDHIDPEHLTVAERIARKRSLERFQNV